MATLATGNPTLLDIAKAIDPDGKVAKVVEILNQTNEILDDMSWKEGNMVDGHKSTIRTYLPTPTWRKFYGGIQPSKGGTAQVKDSTGMLEALAEIDKAVADLNGNTASYRLSEDKAHIEGMNQEMATKLFYGNELLLSESFTGLTPRFNLSTQPNGENIIKAGGAGTDNASIWLVVWGDETVHGILPKGSTAGLQVNDEGVCWVENADGANGRMKVYRTHYRWDAGLCVKDWRYVVRICNIDKSALTKDASGGSADLPDLCYQALETVPNLSVGRAAFYMSRGTRSMLRRQATNATKNSTLTIDNVGGKMIMKFQEVPLRRVDALAADEALVA
jgi:hypothetical protein